MISRAVFCSAQFGGHTINLFSIAGERASVRFLEFLAANIRNPYTPRLLPRGGGVFDLVRRRSCTGWTTVIDGTAALAAVLPYSEPVLLSLPLIPVWGGHGSTFPLCFGCEGMAGRN